MATDVDSSEFTLIVYLLILDIGDPPIDQLHRSKSEYVDIKISMPDQGTITDLKAILESEEYIDTDADDVEIRVHLTPTSLPLPDTFLVPPSTSNVYVVVQRRSSTDMETRQNRALSDVVNAQMQFNPVVDNQQQQTDADPSDYIFRFKLDNTDDGYDTAQAFNGLFPTLNKLKSNPFIDSLLNDPQLFKETLDVMTNPSLMREMERNSDRVLRHLDVVPGAMNSVRNLVESIQHPLWDAPLLGGEFGAGEVGRLRIQHVPTKSRPNTDEVPNPWVQRRESTERQQVLNNFSRIIRNEPTRTFSGSSAHLTHRSPATTTPQTEVVASSSVLSNNDSHRSSSISSQPNFNQPSCPISSCDSSHANKELSQCLPSQMLVETIPVDQPTLLPPSSAPIISEPKDDAHQSASSPVNQCKDRLVEGQKVDTIEPSSKESSSKLLPSAVGQYPYLYQSIFPSHIRLKSLGGLALPHAAHITGVIRPRQTSQNSPAPSESTSSKDMTAADTQTSEESAESSNQKKKKKKNQDSKE